MVIGIGTGEGSQSTGQGISQFLHPTDSESSPRSGHVPHSLLRCDSHWPSIEQDDLPICRSMAEYSHPQEIPNTDHEDLELPQTLTSSAHPQYPSPSSRGAERRGNASFPVPTLQHPSSGDQTRPKGPTISPTLHPSTWQWHRYCGSNLFHDRERQFLSRPTVPYLVKIDIDLPDHPQAVGGSYVLPPSTKTRQSQPSQPSSLLAAYDTPLPPSQHQSSSEHRRTQSTVQPLHPHYSQTTPTNPFPAVGGSIKDHHDRQHSITRHQRHHPYPQPELRPRPPQTINGET